MKESRLNAVVAYALAIASEADEFKDRDLGPIHLLKYLYLGDLAFAEENGGSSYSGVQWKFHKFGPWSLAAFEQLADAAQCAGAMARSIPSAYKEDDAIRWRLSAPALAADLGSSLPPTVARAIRLSVKCYGNDTSALLHFVYRTGPMLSAAPGDILVFQPKQEQEMSLAEPELPSVSKSQLKKLRDKVRSYMAERKTHGKVVAPQVSYDQDYIEIVNLLDREPGEPVEPASGVLEFSKDVWKSEARRGPDVPCSLSPGTDGQLVD